MPATPYIWNQEWLNANSQRKYPLRDDATCKDLSNTLTLPNDFIVDLVWPVHGDPSIDPSKVHVLNVSVFGNGVTVTIGYDGEDVGGVQFDIASFTRNKQLRVQGRGTLFDTVGTIVIGSLDSIKSFAGSFTFDAAGAGLQPRAVPPDLRGVSAVYLKNGSDVSNPLQGDLVFQAGRNFVLNFIENAGTAIDPHVITFNAVDGAGLNDDCECNEANELPCIKTIDGIQPDINGNFLLLESDCLKLDAIANGLQLSDDCSTPCCGCDELGVVNAEAARMLGQVNAMTSLISQLQGQIANLQNNIIASNLGTTPPP